VSAARGLIIAVVAAATLKSTTGSLIIVAITAFRLYRFHIDSAARFDSMCHCVYYYIIQSCIEYIIVLSL
jgi:hypothetical protein